MLSFRQLIYFVLLTWKKGPKTGRKNQHQETKIQNNFTQKLGPQKEIAGERRVQSLLLSSGIPSVAGTQQGVAMKRGCLRGALVAEGGKGKRNTCPLSSSTVCPASANQKPDRGNEEEY